MKAHTSVGSNPSLCLTSPSPNRLAESREHEGRAQLLYVALSRFHVAANVLQETPFSLYLQWEHTHTYTHGSRAVSWKA